MATDIKIHIGQTIRQRLDDKQRKVAWLAREINYDNSNLHKLLKQKHIYPDLLYKISIAMEEDFFALYSQQIAETLKNG
ncbi:hypothetical protein [Candidatus Symbiothrix dinenymphae]|uniref:hypothetical protein n=1 Tax=Candidatus Symbiothrix dinenymphae TaxID=467085 RepID=UPI0006BFE099|nr:hypothetical protein [Candidatus Symbiothrix dinenymphae]GAP72184.1 hypothetical protein SAMD00024442_26_37 [Candidatus Symbiothrix dinenymphae]